jgi:predicted RNase H-like HicB family nuclease
MLESVKYIVYKEDKYYVSQCLNVEVASFGNTIDEATNNLREALDLYFEDEPQKRLFPKINEALLGEFKLSL